MLKYLGSKRRLVPVLGAIASATGARTALDLFTGTTRVAQEFKRRGLHTIGLDLASYAYVLAQCYLRTDAGAIDESELAAILAELNALPPQPGYVTEQFCEQARYFQPHNGARIDAIRQHLADHYREHPLFPVLLTALLLAADRVDSTAGLQMAYLKNWSPRSHRRMELTRPDLLPGPGGALWGDAVELAPTLEPVDLAYLDPPYNQHRYFTNYHVWETLVRWDAPQTYGVARKRVDARGQQGRSAFNSRRTMPAALAELIASVRARTVILSYNDEAWVTAAEVVDMARAAGFAEVRVLEFDSRRYIGSQIGIFNQAGEKVGEAGKPHNTEYIFIAGPSDEVEAAAVAATSVPQRVG